MSGTRTLDPDRVYRAAQALSDGRVHIRPGGRPGTYLVPSFTTDSTYTVDLTDRRCTCPDATFRGATCKHVYAALIRGMEA